MHAPRIFVLVLLTGLVGAGTAATGAGAVVSDGATPATLRAALAVPAAEPAIELTAVTVPGAPCQAIARACIDLSSNQAWLIKDGAVEYGPVPITHGRPDYPTPAGTFHVTFKDKDHRSSIFNNAPMPYSVFFNGGIAFHEGSLSVLSHGCVHLSHTAAQRFFEELNPGDVVQVVP